MCAALDSTTAAVAMIIILLLYTVACETCDDGGGGDADRNDPSGVGWRFFFFSFLLPTCLYGYNALHIIIIYIHKAHQCLILYCMSVSRFIKPLTFIRISFY